MNDDDSTENNFQHIDNLLKPSYCFILIKSYLDDNQSN